MLESVALHDDDDDTMMIMMLIILDIDECGEDEYACDTEISTCINNIGSYQCKCHTGYESIAATECERKAISSLIRLHALTAHNMAVVWLIIA